MESEGRSGGMREETCAGTERGGLEGDGARVRENAEAVERLGWRAGARAKVLFTAYLLFFKLLNFDPCENVISTK